MKRRHLHPVDGEPAGLLSETEARQVHRQVADELRGLSDMGLVTRARVVAEDFKAPGRHKALTLAEWCALATRMHGDVADQIANVTLIGGPRPKRQARAAIERAIGLLLVLDDSLRDLEDEGEGA